MAELVPRKMKSSRRSRPPVERMLESSDGEVARERLHRAAERLQLRQKRLGGNERRPDLLGGLAEALEVLRRAGGERPGVLERAVDAGGRDAEVGEGRRGLFGELFELFEVGTELAQEDGEFVQVFGELAPVAGGGGRHGVGLGEEFGELAAVASERDERAVAFDGEVAEHLVLGGEDAEHLFQFAQRRVGAVQNRVQVAAPTGEAGAEFVDDDRQALVLGQVVDVVEQVHVDRARGVGHGQVPLPRAFLPRREPDAATAAAACLQGVAGWAGS